MGGKRCAGLGLLLAPILLLFALDAGAEDQQAPQAQQALAPTIILLDGSISMWARLGGQSKVAIVRLDPGSCLQDYEDRIAFGLVAFGHRRGGACAEAELMAKPGELASKSPGKLLFGAGFKPKATNAGRGGAGRGRQADAAHGSRRRAHHRRPRQLQGQCLRHGKVAEASGAGLAHPCDRLRPQGEANRQGSCLRGKDHRGPVPHRCHANDLKQDFNAVLDVASKSAPRSVPVASTSPAPPAPPAAAPPPPSALAATPRRRECPPVAATPRRAQHKRTSRPSSAACAYPSPWTTAQATSSTTEDAGGNRPGEKCATRGTASPLIGRVVGPRLRPDRHAEARGHSAEGKCCSGADA